MLRSVSLLLLAFLAPVADAQCELQKLHPEVDGRFFRVYAVEGELAVCSSSESFVLYERTPLGWVPGQVLTETAGLANAGGAALDGDRLAVNRYDGTDSMLFVYERPAPGQPFALTAQLVPSVAPLLSGSSTLALEGDVLVVGMPDVHIAQGPGHVFLFEHASGAWSETFDAAGTLTPFGGGLLGWDVDVDGGVVFARERGYDPVGIGFVLPAVHVYAKGGGGWAEVQTLDEEGSGLSADGGRLATVSSDGTVRIHAPIAGTWTETASFSTPDDNGPVVLDGSVLAIGEPWSDQSGAYSGGAVHVYAEAGGAWSPSATLFASDAQPGAQLGGSIALDGDTLLASASGDEDAGFHGSFAKGAAYAWSLSGQGCPTLTADLHGIPSATGGTQTLRLAPGAAFAGDLYVLAGSLSGFWPGTPFAGVTIPLNVDLYLEYTLFHGGSPPLSAPFGFLDAQGEATVTVTLPPNPDLAGLKAHHAFGIADASLSIVHVSNPVPLVVP